MMTNLSKHNAQKVEVLYDLIGWIKDCTRRIEDGNDEAAARTLKKIIDTMENPVALQNLKDVFNDLNVPF